MADAILSDFASFINQQIAHQCQIQVRLRQLDTLMEVCLSTSNFYDLSNHHLQEYFSLVAQLITELFSLNQQSLNELSQHE